MRSLAICIIVWAISACSHVGIQSDEQKIATACASASAAMKVLIAANEAGALSETQQAVIRQAIGVAAPICAAEQPPTLDDVRRQAFVAAITLLTTAAVEAAAKEQAP